MARSFSQRENLTIRIKGLLQEYPVGTSILREILQNSDDAGASVQRFLLDRRTYPTTDLIDPALKCYQGPALLLYNDSVFKVNDFNSLRNLGKSGKRHEALKTGKFGLGFNSVYNLTDAPMILSGEHLVILEPHEEIKDRDLRGGLQINFTDGVVSQNQLKPFEGFLADRFTEQFHGTIIRLPLRTAENAARSEISSDIITTDDIMGLFDTFKNEAIENLLFLKKIERIEVHELSEGPFSATSKDCAPTLLYSLELGDSGNPAQLASLRAERAILTSALEQCASQHKETQTTCTTIMTISMKPSAEAEVRQSSWLVHHVVGGIAVPDVEEKFLRDEKLLMWIGLATPLDFEQSFSGRLFTFLPLPIATSFPIHIHGIFGLTRDRRNLVVHDPDYTKGSNMDKIATWNKHLFQESIPSAWVNFLDKLKEIRHDSLLPYFPPVANDQGETIWKDMLPNLFRHVVNKKLKLFQRVPSSSSQSQFQWESLNNAFVTNAEEAIVQILADSGMSLVRIPQDIQPILAANTIPFSKITPFAAREYLKTTSTNWSEILSAKSKHELLDYLCSDDNFGDLAGLGLIPLANGEFTSFISFDNTESVDRIYVKMTEGELELFGEWSHRLLKSICLPQLFCDPEKLSALEQATNLRPWDLESTVSFLEETFVKNFDVSLEEIPDSTIPFERLSELWKWIDEKDDSTGKFDDLWLIPTNRGTLRKVRTKHAVIRSEDLSQADTQTLIQLLERAGVAFVREGFTVNPSGYLSRSGLIKVISDIDTVMNWLADVTCPVDLSVEEATALRTYVSRHLRMPNISPQILNSLRALPIYKVLLPSSIVGQKFSNVLRNLPANSSSQFVPVVHQEAIPQLDECTFIDVSDSDSKRLVCDIIGIEIYSFQDFLTALVLPNLESQPEYLIDMLIRMVLSNLDKIPDDQRKQYLQNFKFVKVCSIDETVPTCSIRRAPSELVDPDIKMLINLFLPHEATQPTGIYKERDVIHQLIALGMNTRLTPDLMEDRINCFVDTWAEASEEMKHRIHQNAVKLLAITDNFDNSDDFSYPSVMFLKPWLPAVSQSNECESRLMLASECRDKTYAELASHAIPIVDYQIRNPLLRERFGWNDALGMGILEAQILGLISTPSIPKMSLVAKMTPVLCKLEEMMAEPSSELIRLKANLCEREWIPVDDRLRATSHMVFNSSISNLHPYASILPSHLALHAPRFFEFMGVAKSFSKERLVDILEQIQEASQSNEGILDTKQKEVAVNIIEYLAQQIENDDKSATLEGIYDRILIPDATGRLMKISTLTFSNVPKSVNISHSGPVVSSKISLSVAERLKIPMLSQRILGESMDNKDSFSEHSHKEDICTRIRNTLREYSVDSTSNEFVANADDSDSATRVCWVFDRDGQYPTSSLLCSEMAEWQGPAIYCYNDGNFSDEDIEALIRVGSGSKQSNSNKIGKYGLGFMDAYHFTDVPSMVSGDSAIFLDPQQRFLPPKPDRPWERFSGLHINLRRLSESQFKDQFAPFLGLFGFDPCKSFKGTLFRFPLRRKLQREAERKPILTSGLVDSSAVGEIFDKFYETAQQSLFFLRKIEKIEAFELGRDRQMKPLWSVSLENLSQQTREARRTLTVSKRYFTLDVRIKYQGSARVDERNGPRTEKWIVLTDCAPMADVKGKLLEIANRERLIPHVGLAVRLVMESTNGDGEQKKLEPKLILGESRLICHLPIKAGIGLPVHSHGCFALHTDRQSIRMGIPDVRGIRDPETEWNLYLMQRLAKLYVRTLTIIATHPDRTSGFYDYWPEKTNSYEYMHDEFWKLVRSDRSFTFETHTNPTNTMSPAFITASDDSVFENIGESSALNFVKDILKRCNYDVVCVPLPIREKLLADPVPAHFRLTTPSFMREAIQNSPIILDMVNSGELTKGQFVDFLKYIVSDKDWKALDGCQVLPLKDGTMATITLQSSANCRAYYMPTTELESEVFDFAKNQLVSESIPNEFRDLLIAEDTMLNVSSITSSAIQKLVGQQIQGRLSTKYDPKGSSFPNALWIQKFWQYWDSKGFPIALLEDMPLLPVGNPPEKLVSVNHVNQLSCIQSPSTMEFAQVVQKISGIFIMNGGQIPSKLIKIQAFSLENFLNCLGAAHVTSEFAVRDCIRSRLSHDDLIQLRKCILEQMTLDIGSLEKSQKRVLSQLPIWQVWPDKNNHFATAEEAFVLPDPKVFLEMIQQTLFFRESPFNISLLKAIGIQEMSNWTYFNTQVIPSLPLSISNDQIATYRSFLEALLSMFGAAKLDCEHPLSNVALIPDRDGILRRVKDMFDPRVELFRTTFDLKRREFLPHSSFEGIVQDILNLGIKHAVTSSTFTACALEIERLNDDPLVNIYPDTIRWQGEHVFNYLNTDIEKIHFTDEEWLNLKAIRFIPSSSPTPSHGPEWRTKYTTAPLLSCLNDLVLPMSADVVWTSRPIFHSKTLPSTSLRARDAAIGALNVPSVIDHLVTLAEVVSYECQLEDEFLKSLEATYEFLNTHAEEAAHLLQAHKERSLFLNSDDSTVDPSDRSLWVPASSLVSGISYNPSKTLKCASGRLLAYENLLRAAGALTVIQIDFNMSLDDYDHAGTILRRCHEFYISGGDIKLKSVVLIAGLPETDPERFSLNPMILAASSPYFEKLLSDQVPELEVTYNDLSPQTLRHVLTYVYTGRLDGAMLDRISGGDSANKGADLPADKSRELLEHLHDLLYAATKFSLDHMKRFIEKEIQLRKLVRVETVDWLLKTADKFQADRLAAHCREFREKNSKLVEVTSANSMI